MPTNVGKVDINDTTDLEFINEVQEELTVQCSLPFKIPKKRIASIIQRSAQWMYKNYEDSVEERFFVVNSSNFERKEFKSTKTIVMPECIFSIFGLFRTGDGVFDFIDGDGAAAEYFIFQSFSNRDGTTSTGSRGLMNYVFQSYFYSIMQQVLEHPISYNYNRNSRKLVFTGEIPDNHVVLQTYTKLPLRDLYQDEVFFRFVVAKAMSQLSLALGAVDFSLIGNAKINTDVYEKKGKEELKEIAEEIKGEEGADWFFMNET